MTKDVTAARNALMAAASKGTHARTDAVAVFLAKIDAQVELAKSAAKGTAIKERTAWFNRRGDAYVLKIGRSGLDMGQGVTRFDAKDLNEVQTLLATAKTVIAGDDDLRATITAEAEGRKRK